jgi:hypothetical protein
MSAVDKPGFGYAGITPEMHRAARLEAAGENTASDMAQLRADVLVAREAASFQAANYGDDGNDESAANCEGQVRAFDEVLRKIDRYLLLPGERRAANGVVIGSGAHPDIPRHGADETDNDYPAEGE